MPKQKPLSEKVEEGEKPPKPPGYNAFEKLLKRVINTPPLRKARGTDTAEATR